MEKKSRYVTLRYDDSENDYIDKIIEYIKTKEDLIVNFFELEDKIKNIYGNIWNDLNRFKKYLCETHANIYKTEDDIPNWVIGEGGNENGFILVSWDLFKERHPKDTFTNYCKDFVHEFVHQCIKLVNPKLLSIDWINEGLATYLSGQGDEDEENSFHYDIRNFNPEMKTYNDKFMAVKYVIENYDDKYVKKLLNDYDFTLNETPRLIEEMIHYYNEIIKKHN